MAHATLSDGILVYLESLRVKIGVPVVRLVQESLILLLNVPHLICVIRFERFVKLVLPSEERTAAEIFLEV